jgi:hypothetical protein
MIQKYINQNRFTLDHIQNKEKNFFVDKSLKRKSLNYLKFILVKLIINEKLLIDQKTYRF